MPDGRKPGTARAGASSTPVLLALCGALAGWALVELLRRRAALSVLWPAGFPTLAALLSAGIAAAAAGLLLRLRRGARSLARRPCLAPRALLYAFAGAAAVQLVALQPYRGLVALQAFGAAAAVLALLAFAAPPLLGRLPRRLVSIADLALFLACLLAIGGELALRAAAALDASPLFATRSESLTAFLERQRMRPGTVHAGWPVNSAGHYDEELTAKTPGLPLAASIGDSFSTGVVPHAYHFTTVAERRLGRGAVHNLGVPGIGLAGYLHLLRHEALLLDPDVVVVNVFIGNDLAEGLEHGRARRGLARWLDAEQLLLAVVLPRAAALAREWWEGGGVASTAAETPRGPRDGPGGAQAPDFAGLERLFPWVADPGREIAGFTPQRFEAVERERAWAVCDPATPPDWPRIRELLLEMRAACAGRHFAVMLIPDEFQVEDEVWELVRSGPGGEGLDRDLPQRVLGAWLAAQGIAHLDLLPVLRAVDPWSDGRRRLYHLRDTHFNARGNAAAGEALAGFLRRWWS